MSLRESIKEKLKSLGKGGFGFSTSDEPSPYQYGDRVSQDKRVLSLRRQRNRQMDIVEKRRLERDIKRFEKKEFQSVFYDNSILSNGKKGFSKRKPSVKAKSMGFLGKGRLK